MNILFILTIFSIKFTFIQKINIFYVFYIKAVRFRPVLLILNFQAFTFKWQKTDNNWEKFYFYEFSICMFTPFHMCIRKKVCLSHYYQVSRIWSFVKLSLFSWYFQLKSIITFNYIIMYIVNCKLAYTVLILYFKTQLLLVFKTKNGL